MTIDYLIIGQGISGTMLSYFLHKEGKSFLIIDNAEENSSSRIAAGVINPVTGRRYVTTWMIDDVLTYSISIYEELEKLFNTKLVYRKNIIDFFPSVQMRESFVKRITEDDTYVHTYPDQNYFNPYFNYDFGCGEISPSYTIDLSSLLLLWRNKMVDEKKLLNDSFHIQELSVEAHGIHYRDITASRIIFCNGKSGCNNPYFSLLPFAPNKGEAITISCEGLPDPFIYKRSLVLVPLPEKDLFWLGSNYLWEFDNELPSENFMNQSKMLLDKWLKLPYKIISHKASVRPATLERRPFVGLHPQFSSIGILNGMGSKGTSLAPYFANQLVQYLVHGLPLTPEADVKRFTRILSK